MSGSEALITDSRTVEMMGRHRENVPDGRHRVWLWILERSSNSFHSKAEARADKFDAKLREGVWLGLDSRTDENIIGTSYGIYRAAILEGVPEDKRWGSAKALAVI